MRFKKIQRDFLWGVSTLEKKLHLVNWSIICRAASKVFLLLLLESGIGDLPLKKMSFGSKLFRKNMERKLRGWRSYVVRGRYGVSPQKAIRKGWDIMNF